MFFPSPYDGQDDFEKDTAVTENRNRCKLYSKQTASEAEFALGFQVRQEVFLFLA